MGFSGVRQLKVFRDLDKNHTRLRALNRTGASLEGVFDCSPEMGWNSRTGVRKGHVMSRSLVG